MSVMIDSLAIARAPADAARGCATGRGCGPGMRRTGGAATRFADLYVLRDGRIAEHRHVVEPLSGALR